MRRVRRVPLQPTPKQPRLGRISWLRRVRLENALGHGNFLSGLKLSGERDGGLGLARFSAVCPLGDHMHANGLLWHGVWHAGMAYGRCCMYGPNYVKLSRVFAVQLFRMFIGHYAALPPVRSEPHWPHSHAITASIRLALALTHALQHPLLATQTSAVASTTCLDYLHSHTRTIRPSMASPTYLCAYFQRILGVAPSPLAPDHTRQHTLLATQTSAVATTTCLDYLHPHTRTIRPSTASPTYPYAYFQRILGVAPSPLALAETRQHTLLATQTSTVATTACLDYLHSHTRTMHPSMASPMNL
jgi:uncharacterized protein YbdZ (MbtH family)